MLANTRTHTHTTIIHTHICTHRWCAVQCSAAVGSAADSCLSAASSSQCSKVTQCYRPLLGEPPPADSQLPACASSLPNFTSFDSSLDFKLSCRSTCKEVISVLYECILFWSCKVRFFLLVFFKCFLCCLSQLYTIRFIWRQTVNDALNLIIMIVSEWRSLAIFFLIVACNPRQ